MGGKGHGGRVNKEQGEVGLVFLEVGPVEFRLSDTEDVFDLWEEGVSGIACGITFCENMPDILPLPARASTAVAGDGVDASVSTLFGQHPIGHIVMA